MLCGWSPGSDHTGGAGQRVLGSAGAGGRRCREAQPGLHRHADGPAGLISWRNSEARGEEALHFIHCNRKFLLSGLDGQNWQQSLPWGIWRDVVTSGETLPGSGVAPGPGPGRLLWGRHWPRHWPRPRTSTCVPAREGGHGRPPASPRPGRPPGNRRSAQIASGSELLTPTVRGVAQTVLRVARGSLTPP